MNSMTLETGLSDHHRMTITVLKKYFIKSDPIIINYCDYKSFNGDIFRNDVKRKLEQLKTLNIEEFKNIFMKALSTYAPLKKKGCKR